MPRTWRATAILLGALCVATPAAGQQPREGRSGLVVEAAVTAYNGARTRRVTGVLDVAADRTIDGDVAVLNGPVTVAGKITGSLVAINADVRLTAGASIGRDLIVVGGTVSGREGASVGGEIMHQAELLRYHLVDVQLVADAEPAYDDAWWKRRPLRRPVRSDDRSWNDLTFTSAHTYNRVEGLPILLGPRIHQVTSWGRFTLDAFGVVRTAGPVQRDRGTLGHDATSELQLGRKLGVGVGGRLFDIVDGVEDWQMGVGEVGLGAFVLHRDFLDYYRRHGGLGFVRLHAGRDADLTMSLSDERWESAPERDPLSVFHGGEVWRPNPAMDEGPMHVASARLRADTRRREGSPWGGWFLNAEWERGTGTLAREAGLLAVMPAPEAVDYQRGFVDARRYNRLSPNTWLNLRVATGGWLSGDRLPMQRRVSVGGPATLPGYDFREAPGDADVLTCGGTALPGAPALCDRMMLFQAEYRRDFGIGWLRNDTHDDWWRPGLNRRASWVLFADAGRGWLIGEPDGAMTYTKGSFPDLSTFLSDVGVGVDFGGLGFYLAKATTTAREPVNVLLRAQVRF